MRRDLYARRAPVSACGFVAIIVSFTRIEGRLYAQIDSGTCIVWGWTRAPLLRRRRQPLLTVDPYVRVKSTWAVYFGADYQIYV